MADNIYLILEEILEKYWRPSDESYNWLRYDKQEREFWLEKEISETLTKMDIKFKISLNEIRISCSHSIAILSLSYMVDNEVYLWVKELHQY